MDGLIDYFNFPVTGFIDYTTSLLHEALAAQAVVYKEWEFVRNNFFVKF
jgi:hypothetical protein